MADGELSALVTVDLFNEGVDLPFVDTLLLLRPTQSPVLFQQQIGRGLRLADKKESCLVLDFVGQHRVDFRFDRLLATLTGRSRRELLDDVEQGFGHLPPGCHIHLQRQAREQVRRGLRELPVNTWPRLRAELQAYANLRGRREVSLSRFMEDQRLDIDEIYRSTSSGSRSGWATLKRDAGLIVSEPGPEEAYFSRRFADLLHIDDSPRADLIERLATDPASFTGCGDLDRLRLQMLAYQVDGRTEQRGSHEAFVRRLQGNSEALSELREVARALQSRAIVLDAAVPGLEDTPLCLHATYGIREILTAVGWLTAQRRTPFQAGTLSLEGRQTELLFVTLDKRQGFHAGVAYEDYAISTERFHWQSQNRAGPNTRAGRRYLESATNGWKFQLFVRLHQGSPYRCCGPAELVSAHGERPMSIVWALQNPLPVRMFREFSVLRGA